MEKTERIKIAKKRLKQVKTKLENRLLKTEAAFIEAKKISDKLDKLEKGK